MRVTKQTSSKKVSCSRGAFQTFAWLFHWDGNWLLRSQRACPTISPGLMKKLEPTLHMKRRRSHSHVDIATIQPLKSELQDKTKRGIGASTTKDEFTFPSSPERKVAKKTVKDESKTEAQASKKDLAKTRTILKVGIYIFDEKIKSIWKYPFCFVSWEKKRLQEAVTLTRSKSFICKIREGLSGVWGNKGTKEKYRREKVWERRNNQMLTLTVGEGGTRIC